MEGPASRNPSLAERSPTLIRNLPARRPFEGARPNFAPGPIDPARRVADAGVGVGVGGGVVTAPTVKLPRICATCSSHWKTYVPSTSVTVNVWSPTVSTPVATLTPGPVRSKLWSAEWSWTRSVYVPAARWVTAFPVASLSEIVNESLGPTSPTSVGLSARAEPTALTRATSAATTRILTATPPLRRVRGIGLLRRAAQRRTGRKVPGRSGRAAPRPRRR
jgi:hypothetical protein